MVIYPLKMVMLLVKLVFFEKIGMLVYNWAKADDLHKSYVARPVGNLVLKGRKSATKVGEHRTLRARNPGIHKDFMGQNDGF
jgi:hypothetical protein